MEELNDTFLIVIAFPATPPELALVGALGDPWEPEVPITPGPFLESFHAVQ